MALKNGHENIITFWKSKKFVIDRFPTACSSKNVNMLLTAMAESPTLGTDLSTYETIFKYDFSEGFRKLVGRLRPKFSLYDHSELAAQHGAVRCLHVMLLDYPNNKMVNERLFREVISQEYLAALETVYNRDKDTFRITKKLILSILLSGNYVLASFFITFTKYQVPKSDYDFMRAAVASGIPELVVLLAQQGCPLPKDLRVAMEILFPSGLSKQQEQILFEIETGIIEIPSN